MTGCIFVYRLLTFVIFVESKAETEQCPSRFAGEIIILKFSLFKFLSSRIILV